MCLSDVGLRLWHMGLRLSGVVPAAVLREIAAVGRSHRNTSVNIVWRLVGATRGGVFYRSSVTSLPIRRCRGLIKLASCSSTGLDSQSSKNIPNACRCVLTFHAEMTPMEHMRALQGACDFGTRACGCGIATVWCCSCGCAT